MRRSIRPFTVEKKKGGRAAEKTATATAPPSVFADFEEPTPPRKSARHNPNLAAAEALFGRPTETQAKAKAAEAEDANGKGRILQSLEELPPSPLEQMLAEPPTRRGRKPGSKNKAKEPDEAAPAEPKKRGRKPGSKNKPRVTPDAAETMLEDVAPAPFAQQLNFTITPLGPLRRLGRLDRSELPRGERWKARLPRFAR